MEDVQVPSIIQDLALILVTAGVVTLLFKKLKQPLVLGYIMAGVIVSPNLPITMSVVDKENVEVWGGIGVIFLLFTLGLDFSFKKILKMGIAPIIASVTIIFSMMSLGFMAAKCLALSNMNALFLAGMLAMSSTTIIYKAFDDLRLKQQQFSSLVMSVLILEDILAIVMMVVLSTLAQDEMAGAEGMLENVFWIAFFIILWFVAGLFFIPLFLRKVRPLINDETLLIVALALCCAMAVYVTTRGFSSAFGAFVMGSILAETVEAKRIEKVVEPVKNLFGAIFFVSVGMLVDINVVINQWLAIIIITLVIILGQSIFGTFSFMLAGQPLKTAMRCGFSMAQIGEFAFIIAALGLDLGVVSDFIYPVVVMVSVITTFSTPYMIRGAVPVYNMVEKRLPKVWIRRINKISDIAPMNYDSSQGYWKPLLTQMLVNTIIYCVLTCAVIFVILNYGMELVTPLLPKDVADMLCVMVTVVMISPFLRALVMKKNRSEEFRSLWIGSRHNRAPLIFTIIVRIVIAAAFVGYVCSYITYISNALLIFVAVAIVVLIVYSRRIKKSSISMERLFFKNLHSRELAARASGKKRPLFEGHLLDRDIHIALVDVPQNSTWAGKSLKELNLAHRFGIHVSSIMRGYQKINIPSGDDVIFPLDQLNVIGTDAQLSMLLEQLTEDVYPEPMDFDGRDMQLQRFAIAAGSPFEGKSLITSLLRDKYNCMLIGREQDAENLETVSPSYLFAPGDILWIVGEERDIQRLSAEI